MADQSMDEDESELETVSNRAGFTPVKPRGRPPKERKKPVETRTSSSDTQEKKGTVTIPKKTLPTTINNSNNAASRNDATPSHKFFYCINASKINSRVELSVHWSKVARYYQPCSPKQ